MVTLSYGFQKPQTNDRGNVVFPALEANWQQVNDHNHNGVNSAPIPSAYLEKTQQSILSANWTLVADGHYTQTLVLPLGLQYDNVTFSFRITTGEQVFPSVSKASNTSYKVDFDDSSKSLVCLIN